MKNNNRDIDRIPFRVESPRGDDKLGTNTATGEVNHPSLSGEACSVRSKGNWLIRRHTKICRR